jgi:hypothetical protein
VGETLSWGIVAGRRTLDGVLTTIGFALAFGISSLPSSP